MQNTDTTKYIIHAKIKADGVVERPDVVGAIFGQTEGLLGDDLDLRELQKSGRMGRIDVNIKSSAGKSTGTISIPSSLDKIETSVLAASLETIDRIGPCVSTISISRVEDVRSSKRKHVIDRAKAIIIDLFDENVLESQEITERVKQAVRIEDIVFYGKENIPAGPNVQNSDAIIVVEGRADVTTLLKYGIKNAIAVGGTNVPQPVADLCKKKTVTAFTDGDRGGELIIKELLQVTDIDFISRAPDGKMVEDLTQKEIIKALHQKIPIEQAMGHYQVEERKSRSANVPFKRKTSDSLKRVQIKDHRPKKEEIVEEKTEEMESAKPKIEPVKKKAEPVKPDIDRFQSHIDDISGSFTARLIDEKNHVLKEVPVRDLANELKDAKNSVKTVVFDGVITQRLVDIAFERGIENLVGIKKGSITKIPASLHVHATSS
ncbi:MAG: DNA primase [Candidatus Argoarchaeum ethanivorans]|uniref:DNA primase DnaG n=1 Tax=Candidatus Argoarchaeum ethanivorans TaxID=2608793 RepID=A0A8B3S1F2_9EURY|nr:MAG: DNA primase [Candidatus Argoarchaeum ethanivorans]